MAVLKKIANFKSGFCPSLFLTTYWTHFINFFFSTPQFPVHVSIAYTSQQIGNKNAKKATREEKFYQCWSYYIKLHLHILTWEKTIFQQKSFTCKTFKGARHFLENPTTRIPLEWKWLMYKLIFIVMKIHKNINDISLITILKMWNIVT